MRRSSKLALPMRSPQDVIPYLGKPTHWKPGRSAKLLAEAWYDANGFPPLIAELLLQSDAFAEAEFLDGWLERETDLADSRPTPTQTDLFGLIGTKNGLAVLGIEAKVDESFGPTVSEWLTGGGSGKIERLNRLTTLFEVSATSISHLRYQLFHRTAAVILEARRFRTNVAVLIVQSFCPLNTGLRDAASFFSVIGLSGLEPDRLVGPGVFGGVNLWVGWSASAAGNQLSDRLAASDVYAGDPSPVNANNAS